MENETYDYKTKKTYKGLLNYHIYLCLLNYKHSDMISYNLLNWFLFIIYTYQRLFL